MKAVFWFLLRIALAGGIILWLLRGDFSSYVKTIANMNVYWLLLAAAFYLFHIVVAAWRWHLLLVAQNIHVSVFESFVLIMKSMFFSLVIPGGAIGGDIMRVGFLVKRTPPGRKLEGAFTIFIDRFTGMVALFSLAIFITILEWDMLFSIQSNIMQMVVLVLVLGSIGGLGAGFVMFFHREFERIRLFAFFAGLANKYSHGTYNRLINALDLYRQCWKVVLVCIISGILFMHMPLAACVYCICKAAGTESVPAGKIIAATTIGSTAGLIPLTPSGLGTRDAVISGILTASGMPKDKATPVPIVNTAVILFFNLAGGLFFILHRKSDLIKVSERPAKEGLSES